MMEPWVRAVNIRLYERYAKPVKAVADPKRRSFVNDVAFAVFEDAVAAKRDIDYKYPSDKHVQLISRNVRRQLAAAGYRSGTTYGLRERERGEARAIARQTHEFFREVEKHELLLSPALPGCGFIVQSYGDVIAGATIYEVKAGERSFRSADFRQLLVYSALNYAAGKYKISHLGILNPRLGTYFRTTIEDVARSVSGLTSAELFEEIVQFVSSGAVSK